MNKIQRRLSARSKNGFDSKFLIVKQAPLMRGGHVSGESIVEVICESHKDEERDAFIRRYNNEPLPAPPPPKPVVPVIEPILADDARPAFNYESVASAAAATPKWE